MKTVTFPNGDTVAALGLGTWRMGERPDRRRDEIAALREGVDLGMTVIDTAEMYGDGEAERLVGEALGDRRDSIFIVSKVYPQNASRARLAGACRASLGRLGTDRIDLYLLHWRGSVPLAETVDGLEALRADGLIRAWGVSNLDTDEMAELVEAGGTGCQTDQILYNLGRRGPEHGLLPWLSARGMPVMAYSPVEQGRLLTRGALPTIARDLGASPAEVALAWLLARDGVLAIPKAGDPAHLRENRRAADLVLPPDVMARLEDAYPRPSGRVRLEVL